MSNMSYCRFENTLSDLQDCADVITEAPSSKSEQCARKHLIELCATLLEELGYSVEKPEQRSAIISFNERFFKIVAPATSKEWKVICDQAALGQALAELLSQNVPGTVSYVVTELPEAEYQQLRATPGAVRSI